MKYKVVEWINTDLSVDCEFVAADEVTEAMKQAVVNDIREHGYIFDALAVMSPLLNTGEYVNLSYDMYEELVCRAFGFSSEEYESYLDKAPNLPTLSENHDYTCDYPIIKKVTVNDSAFDGLYDAISSNKCNVEIFPAGYIALKAGDVIRFENSSRTDHIDVKVKEYFRGCIFTISDMRERPNLDVHSILDLLSLNRKYEPKCELNYRYDGLSGEELYQAFKDDYATWILLMISNGEFDTRIDAAVFEINDTPLEKVILDAPEDIPVPENIMNGIKEKYQATLAQEEASRASFNQTYQKLKEKMAKRKAEAEREAATNEANEAPATSEANEAPTADEPNEAAFASEANDASAATETPAAKTSEDSEEAKNEKIPFITLDNIGDYFGSEAEDITVADLIERAKKEQKLARENASLEKSIMLLGNAEIYLARIAKTGEKVPSELFLGIKGDLLSIYIRISDVDHAHTVFGEIDEYFDSLTDDEKDACVISYAQIALSYVHFLNGVDDIAWLVNVTNKILSLLDENGSDDVLLIKANCFSLLGAIYFEAKEYKVAIDLYYNALMITKEIEDKTEDIYKQYATLAFNLGNVYFQSDNYTNAATMFKFTRDFCLENEFDDRFTILHYSTNYLSQVYVCTEDYESAIEGYLSYVEYSKENFEGDEALTVEVDFLYRVALIYKKFLDDESNARVYLDKARKALCSIEDKGSDDFKDLSERLDGLFE